MIPGQDDGKVGVDNAKLDGMKDFLVLRCSHPMIMKSDHAVEQTIHFLDYGEFVHSDADKADSHAVASTGGVDSQAPGDCWD
jgi:hypothetical protein